MADAAIHDHDHDHARAAQPRAERNSVLALSAGARLLGVALVVAALWAGVYWALR